MLYLPEGIERTLERIGEVYKRDLKEGKTYFSVRTKSGQTYTDVDTVRIQLERFEKFKTSLENGTSKFLMCEEGKEDEAKIRLMHEIQKYFEPLGMDDIHLIENDVHIQRGLKKRVEILADKPETANEAHHMLRFLNNAYTEGWSMEDLNCKIKDFRFVDSEKEFEEILSRPQGEEMTPGEDEDDLINYTTIRVAVAIVDSIAIYKKKGIFEEYNRFFYDWIADDNLANAIEMFDWWHDVRETAIYYIYLPQ